MAIDTLALSGGTHQSGKTLLSQVEVRILAVIQLLEENAKQANEVSVSVGSAVKGMEGFIGEIEEISADIKLIALNAQVKANLAGSEGKTLGVIAAEAGATGDDPNSGQGKNTTGNEDMEAALRDLLNPLERINAGFIVRVKINYFMREGQTVYSRGLHPLLYPNGLSGLNLEAMLSFILPKIFKKLKCYNYFDYLFTHFLRIHLMDKMTFENKLLLLLDEMKVFLELEKEFLEMPADNIIEHREILKNSTICFENAFDMLRLLVKDLMFELDATREEKC